MLGVYMDNTAKRSIDINLKDNIIIMKLGLLKLKTIPINDIDFNAILIDNHIMEIEKFNVLWNYLSTSETCNNGFDFYKTFTRINITEYLVENGYYHVVDVTL